MTSCNLNAPKLLLFFFFISLWNKGVSQLKITDERLIKAQATLKEGQQKHDSSKIAEGYYLLAKVRAAEYNYPAAYELFYNSLKIYEKRKDWYNAGRVYLRLTDCELEQNHYDEAKGTLQEANDIFKAHNLKKGIRDVYFLYGMIYSQVLNPKLNYDSALFYFRKLELWAIREKDEKQLAGVRGYIGIIYKDIKDKKAIPNLEYAVSVKQKGIYDSPLLIYRTSLASAYLIFHDLSRARKILEESQIFINQGYKFDDYAKVSHYGTYSDYYIAIRNWQKAYELREKHLVSQRHALQLDRDGSVSKWRIRLETEKKELKLKLQKSELENNQKEIRQQRYLLIVTGVFISIFIVLVFYLYKLYQKQKLLSEHNTILIQEQNHRVKNNLQIISSLLSLQSNQLNDSKAKQAVDESQLRIEAMAVLHRQLYDTKELDKIDMELFINNLSDIIFESYGLEDIQLDYHINIHPLEADKAIFLGLMINEFISNACKHAFAEHPAPVLKIDLNEQNHQITMRIKDNGPKPVSFQKKESFGMKLINMMVQQLDGQLSYKYNEGSEFTLKIS